MIDRASALQISPDIVPASLIWTQEQHFQIVQTLISFGCEYVKGREEYTLLKQILTPENFTDVSNFGKTQDIENALISRLSGTGVISPICGAKGMNDTSHSTGLEPGIKPKQFLAPLDIQTKGSIAEVIPSFRVIQSKSLRLNIGFDTEFQETETAEGSCPSKCRLHSEQS